MIHHLVTTVLNEIKTIAKAKINGYSEEYVDHQRANSKTA
jgi:hypothetical protein